MVSPIKVRSSLCLCGIILGAKVRQVNALRKDHSPRRGRFLVIFWTTEKRAKNKVKFMREKRPFSTDGRSHLSPAESFAHPYRTSTAITRFGTLHARA